MSKMYAHNFVIFRVILLAIISMLFLLIGYTNTINAPRWIARNIKFSRSSKLIVHDFSESNYTGYNVGKVKLKYLSNFKNPCWVEKFHDRSHNEDIADENKGLPKPIRLLRKMTVQLDGECGPPKYCTLRCLPYFMVLGVQKSATTDLFRKLKWHPKIRSVHGKEVFWWNQYRFRHETNKMQDITIGDYSSFFDIGLKQFFGGDYINATGKKYFDFILGEGTANTYYDFSHWRNDPRNVNLSEPRITVINDIKTVLPNIKLIIIMRNPTQRLYSNYNMLAQYPPSPGDFHSKVLGSIQWWNTCVNKLPIRNCLYGSPPQMPPVYDGITDITQWWHKEQNYSGELRTGMYVLIMRDWFAVFPRESFLILRTEDYSKNPVKSFNDEIFPFLNVSKIMTESVLRKIKSVRSFVRKYKPMLGETRKILNVFYRPYNVLLSELLKDRKWLWQDT